MILLPFVIRRRVDLLVKHPIVFEQLPIVVFPALAYAWLKKSEMHPVRGLAETRWQ